MKPATALILAALLLASCATQPPQPEVWIKPAGGGSQQELSADDGQCKAQAFAVPGAMNNTLQMAAVYNACMQGKGWGRQ